MRFRRPNPLAANRLAPDRSLAPNPLEPNRRVPPSLVSSSLVSSSPVSSRDSFVGPGSLRLSRSAFTLVELLVVIAIVGVLIGLLLPAVQAARAAARRVTCSNNLKQMSLSLHNYHSAFKRFPGIGDGIRNGWSVQSQILPYAEQSALHDLIDFDVPLGRAASRGGFNPPNDRAAETIVPFFVCPSDDIPPRKPIGYTRGRRTYEWRHAGLNYMVNVGSGTEDNVDYGSRTDGLFWSGSQTAFRDILDGTSSTIMLAETLMGPGFDAPRIASEQAEKYTAVGSGRSIAEMRRFRDEATNADPNTFVSNHSRWSGTRGANWISGFGSSGGAINGWFTPNHPIPDLSMRANLASGPRSHHEAGVVISMADGRVTFVTDSIDLALFRALWTAGGREVVADEL